MSTQSDTPRADSEVFDDRVSVQLARQLEREVNALKAWKESALAVSAELDAQRIAKLLGARLGESCCKVINDKVPELVAERDRLFRALYECYQATGEEAGDLDDFRALVNREAVVVDVVQQLRRAADGLCDPAEEMPLKQWVHAEAARCDVNPSAIYNRIARGKYPHLKFRRVNKRVVFVQIQ